MYQSELSQLHHGFSLKTIFTEYYFVSKIKLLNLSDQRFRISVSVYEPFNQSKLLFLILFEVVFVKTICLVKRLAKSKFAVRSGETLEILVEMKDHH